MVKVKVTKQVCLPEKILQRLSWQSRLFLEVEKPCSFNFFLFRVDEGSRFLLKWIPKRFVEQTVVSVVALGVTNEASEKY